MMCDPEPRIEPPEVEPVLCPVCGAECETIYADVRSVVVGCENCVWTKDAHEWLREQREAWR